MSLLFFPGLLANNVVLENISLQDQMISSHRCNIMFDISWDNSWRTSTTVPTNWDACWVFAKYRVTGGNWHHCTLSTNQNDYFCPGGCTVMPATDGKGVYLYRSQDGSGSINWDLVKLCWKYGLNGVNDDAEVEVKLFAIEMVYIPQSDFYIGDGNSSSLESLRAFHANFYTPVHITSELASGVRVDQNSTYDDQTIKDGIGIDGDAGIDLDNNGTIDNGFYPTGYRSFYIMKYETSQEQYLEFLNTLTRVQQQARVVTDISGTSVTNRYVMSGYTFPAGYNSIRCPSGLPSAPHPVIFSCDLDADDQFDECDGQTLACNYLSWTDVCAYADWAGLRPMTELEFEKATRGPNTPVYSEYAWGNTNISQAFASQGNHGCPDSYLVLNPDVNTGRANFGEIYIAFSSMRRCGEFASSSVNHTRQEAGAGYYGEMEMSGNLSEPAVSLGTVAGRSFRDNNGNGELNAAGYADVDYWPGINGNNESYTENLPYGGSVGVTESAGTGFRGGNTSLSTGSLCISQRWFASMGYPTSREEMHGARFVRTAN
jgi:hypothetical protein